MNNNNCDVSIVVPVYNVEKYLVRCLESIINQSHKNIEIILINDGSTDNSKEICEAYAMKDNRIELINKENGGLSDARNVGIRNASSQYIFFVDSDDYLEKNSVEIMLNCATQKNLDVVCANAQKTYASDQNFIGEIIKGGYNSNVSTGIDYLSNCIKNNCYSAAVWKRMYRTQLIKNNDIYFKKGLLHEDEEWTPRVLMVANRVAYCNEIVYNYFIRENSITQTTNKDKHIKDVMDTCTKMVGLIERQNINTNKKRLINDYFARLYMFTSTYGEFKKSQYINLIDRGFIKNNSYKLKTKILVMIFLSNIQLYRYLMIKKIK